MDELNTFGGVRRMLVSTIAELRTGAMEPARGLAIAATAKTLNDNILAEVAAAKLALQTQGTAHEFVQVARMGQMCITDQRTIAG